MRPQWPKFCPCLKCLCLNYDCLHERAPLRLLSECRSVTNNIYFLDKSVRYDLSRTALRYFLFFRGTSWGVTPLRQSARKETNLANIQTKFHRISLRGPPSIQELIGAPHLSNPLVCELCILHPFHLAQRISLVGLQTSALRQGTLLPSLYRRNPWRVSIRLNV